MGQISGGGGGSFAELDRGSIVFSSTTYVSKNFNGIIIPDQWAKYMLFLESSLSSIGSIAVNMRFGVNGTLITAAGQYTTRFSTAGVATTSTGTFITLNLLVPLAKNVALNLEGFNKSSTVSGRVAVSTNTSGESYTIGGLVTNPSGPVDTIAFARDSGSGSVTMSYRLFGVGAL